MNNITRYRMIFAIICLLVVLFGVLWYTVDPHRYAVQYNPHPRHFVELSGRISPQLFHFTHFDGKVQYRSFNPRCNHLGKPRFALIGVPVITQPNGKFWAVASLDYYQLGFCKWSPFHVNIRVSIGKQHFQISEPVSRTAPMQPNATLTINPACRSLNHCDIQTFPQQTFNPRRSYFYDMTVTLK